MTAASSGSRLDDERLRRLLDEGRALSSERELDRALERLLGLARELTGARYAAIGVLDERREGLADFITAGLHPEVQAAISELPRGRGVLGLLLTDPAPVRIADVTQHPLSYGFPPGHPAMRSFLGVPILIGGEPWGNLYLADKQLGLKFDEGDEESATVLSAWAALAVENARLGGRPDRRQIELQRSVRALEARIQIARAVGSETRLERMLALIAERSRALVHASAVAILLEHDDELVVAAVAGERPRMILGSRIARDEPIAARVLASGRSARVHDLPEQPRSGLGAHGAAAGAGMFAPLQIGESGVGVIGALDRLDGTRFRADDEPLLEAAAASAATAVGTAPPAERERLRDALTAADRERRRSAGEPQDQRLLHALGSLREALAVAHRKHDLALWQRTGAEAIERIERELESLRASSRDPSR